MLFDRTQQFFPRKNYQADSKLGKQVSQPTYTPLYKRASMLADEIFTAISSHSPPVGSGLTGDAD
jgi:hypothetical protein